MVGPKSLDYLRLEAAGHVDCATLLPVEVSSLPRGLHPRCVAFHPQKPLLAVGVQTCVGSYDMMTGVRMGRVDIRTPAVALTFSRDGSLLVVATQEWHIVGINTATWRSRILAPMTEPRNALLDSIMLAVTGGSRPVVFFTRYGKNSIRMAVNTGPGTKKGSSEKKMKWGVKLRLDVNKPVVGLAAHPTASQVLVLFDDGSMRSYALSASGLQGIWPAAYTIPGDAASLARASLSQSPCQTLPHPFMDGAALMAIGSTNGSLLVLEIVGKAEPRVLLKTVTAGNTPVIGVGMLQAERMLFAFTTKGQDALEVLAWQLVDTTAGDSRTVQGSGLALEPLKVHTDDLDAPAAAAAAAGHSSSSSTRGADRKLGLLAAAGSSSGNGFEWQSLWGAGSSDFAETPCAGSFLLDKLLAPVVQSAVMHPTLGCVAVQRAPPLALRQAANIMQQRLGLISAPEAAISRRTAAVPLLRLMHSSMPEANWPGGCVAAMHTGLNFWQTAAGMGTAKLQFPCHFYYLSPGKLSKYALASKKSGCFVDLPLVDTSGKAHTAKQLVHSAKQHAWLVFFHSSGSSSGSTRRSSGGDVGSDGGWHFTLIQDAAAAGQARWFLPGRTGVFLGPQDLYFAVQGANSNTLSVYRTPGFNGKGLPLYTIHLAKQSGLGAGLFAGPPALAVPRIGAEAAAKEAKEAADAADKAAHEAAEAAAAAEAGGDSTSADGAAADADTATGTAAAAAAAQPKPLVGSETGARIRRPGETWRPREDDTDSDAGVSLLPTIGIGPEYQQSKHGKGPHRFMAPGYGANHHDHEGHEQAGELHSGGGVVMWHQAGGKLVMGALPAPGVQYAAGEDSDDPDAEEAATVATARAPDVGQVAGEHTLQLQLNERLISVQWQNMTQGEPLEPYHCAAAILTTQRLMLVSGDLTVLASVDANCGSVGLSNAITSFLWVGPALLYMTAGGQVMQLTWTGQTQHMASVARSPPPLLAGALTDSLLLVRQNPVTGVHEVTSRAVGVLQPLVLGWTSLASCGLLPKGLNTARRALQALLEAFDATHVTSGMLWALIQGWCGDVAAALAAHAADVEPSVQLAANASAGRWPAVVSVLRAEHERSMFYPKPAPQGSQLHHKLLAAAAGAIMHGQFSCAQECLESAGEWETAMALAVCAGDFASLRSMSVGLQSAAALAVGGEHEAADIARLARGLVAAYERSGRAFNMGSAHDWKLRAVMADDSFFSNASDWSFGGPGKMPSMETSSFNAPASFVQDGEVGPVPRADTTTLGSYLGNSDLVLYEPHEGKGPRRSTSDQDFLANLDQLVQLSAQKTTSTPGDGKGNLVRSSSATSSVSSDGGMAAAAAAAGASTSGQARDLFDFSDDEQDSESNFGWAGRKFKIHIKSKEEAEGASPAAAGNTGASTPDLKTAAQKLKLGLGPPGSTPTFKEAFGKGGIRRADSSSSSLDERGRSSSGIDALYDMSFIAKPSSSGAAASSSTSAVLQGGLPPKAPTTAAASGSSNSLSSLNALAGLSSSGTPGLGGPAMRPKTQPPAPPVISDDDFFAALAPVIPERTKSKLLSPPPPPTAAAAGPAGSPAAAAGAASSRTAPQPAAGMTFEDDLFAGLAGTSPAKSPAAAAVAGSGSSSSKAASAPPITGVPPAPVGAAAAAQSVPAAAGPTGGDSTALYLKGVSEMESANWDAAIDSFSRTLQVLLAEAASPSRMQRQAFAAQYLAAVMLLKAAGAGAGAKEAKLYRYACALKLDDRHTLALVKESVLRNKHVANFRYAADQLTWLVTRSLGSAPMEVMAKLQEEIDECDSKGGRNATIAADEKVDEWVSIVATGTSRQDVEEVVLPLLADS